MVGEEYGSRQGPTNSLKLLLKVSCNSNYTTIKPKNALVSFPKQKEDSPSVFINYNPSSTINVLELHTENITRLITRLITILTWFLLYKIDLIRLILKNNFF